MGYNMIIETMFGIGLISMCNSILFSEECYRLKKRSSKSSHFDYLNKNQDEVFLTI